LINVVDDWKNVAAGDQKWRQLRVKLSSAKRKKNILNASISFIGKSSIYFLQV
jgi:hypothetical protein